jgi:hypothetical protein
MIAKQRNWLSKKGIKIVKGVKTNKEIEPPAGEKGS